MNEHIYRQSENCLVEDMEGDILLYHADSASAVQLSESSHMVWKLCDGRRTVGEVIETICKVYPEQAGQIPEDVRWAVSMLAEKHVLERIS